MFQQRALKILKARLMICKEQFAYLHIKRKFVSLYIGICRIQRNKLEKINKLAVSLERHHPTDIITKVTEKKNDRRTKKMV